jgi:hypothetical protein
MKHICKYLAGAALAVSGYTVQAQGLEGIIVEDYYTISAADADYLNNTVGATYPISAGTKVYRIYVDMAPNYKLNTVNGSPLPQGGGPSPNPLDFTTTTTFWNEDGFGTEVPPQTARFDDGAAFDSYITIGTTGRSGGAVGCGTNTQQVGTLKTADTNGNLTLCAVYEGFPNAATNDGNIPGTVPALTYNLGGLIDFAALNADGSSLVVVGDAWATLPNQPGVDPTGTNRQLIAQLTTDGDLSFHINVQLQTADNSALETYVWQTAGAGEVVSPFLTYPAAGTPDCNGVIGGPDVPGAPCNDNNVCTLNDVWSAQCVCAGTPDNTDTDGDGTPNCSDNCPNVAGQQGSTCNDNNACTINDVLNASCVCAGTLDNTDTDGDGVPNCSDNCPNVTGQQGSACDDGNALTVNDVLNANCICVGTPVGCVVNGDCNDQDPCTSDACVSNACVYTPLTTDTDGDGTPDCSDNCPNVAGTQGSACNDNNACTTNDVLNASCVCAGTPDNTDTDGDGVPNCSDNCPAVVGQVGSPCDDGNALTVNDVLNNGCICVGTSVGCVVNGDCNDQDPCTEDACVSNACVFTPTADTDGDGTCDAIDGCPADASKIAPGMCGCGNPEPGTNCDDGNANTTNDQIGANCICAGTVVGVDCEGTPGGSELPGTDCDDGNADTGNDTWSANCVCEGQALDCLGVPGGTATVGSGCNDGNACTTGDVYNTDCLCTGTVQDTDGDGVCDANDNCPNVPGQIGSPCDDNNANTINDVLGNNCVCLGTPIGDCTENLTLSITLDANGSQTSWTLYDATEIGILDAGGPYTNGTPGAVITEPICVPAGCYHLRFSDSGNDGIAGGGYVLRNASNKRIIDASTGSFTTTSELGGVGARNFCVPIGGLNILNNWCDRSNLLVTSPVYCNTQPGATGYQFWIYDAHGSYNRRVIRAVNNLAPVNLNTNPIPVNTWLNIRVRPVFNGPASEFGPACRVRFLPNTAGNSSRDMTYDDATQVTMNLYPNPNRDGLVTLSMEGVGVADETMVDIDVYDMMGKRVFNERTVAAEGIVNHRMDLSSTIGAGLYMVNVTIEGQLYTQRLVIQ